MGINIKISDLLKGLNVRVVNNESDPEVCGISADSRAVSGSEIFAAFSGVHSDGLDYIGPALKAGAKAVLAGKSESAAQKIKAYPNVPFILSEDPQKLSAELALRLYAGPSRALVVVGVTGTNGKTTVCYMLESVFRAANEKVGVIGTINYRFGGRVLEAPNTTPQAAQLQKILYEMKLSGVKYVFMEVSSHALAQDRVYGIEFDLGIFTNLTKEHLDFHKTMKNYFRAKQALFTEYIACNAHKNKSAVINTDDEWGRKLSASIGYPAISYSVKRDSALRGEIVRTDLGGTIMKVKYKKDLYNLKLRLLGRHNAYNALAAFGAAVSLGLKPEDAAKGLYELENVPGRMESVNLGQPYSVIVDYAHTDDALDKVISAVRELKPKRIITVFGCGGNRDKTKRPRMGITAVTKSEKVIITSDNPRDEDPGEIIAEITAGIKSRGLGNYEVIQDREEAIREALRTAQSRDAVILAGKGHENYQIVKNKYFEFDDRQMARKYIKI